MKSGDKDKEIRKLKGTVGHYFTATIEGAIRIEKQKQALAVARHTIGFISQMCDDGLDFAILKDKCQDALKKMREILGEYYDD